LKGGYILDEDLDLFSNISNDLEHLIEDVGALMDPEDIEHFISLLDTPTIDNSQATPKDTRYHQIKKEVESLFRAISDMASSNEEATQLAIKMIKRFKEELHAMVILSLFLV
jgi:hypothetical protein